jgi:hypothetical protein
MAISSCDEETTTIGESLTNDNDRLNTIAASFPVTTQAEWWETAAPSPATDVLTPEPLFDTFGL